MCGGGYFLKPLNECMVLNKSATPLVSEGGVFEC
jgi:hypothetical protein